MTRCSSGKVEHRSRTAARHAAVAVALRRTHDRPRVYACPECHRWHLTSAAGHRGQLRPRRRTHLDEPHPATPAEVEAWFAAHQKAAIAAHTAMTSA